MSGRAATTAASIGALGACRRRPGRRSPQRRSGTRCSMAFRTMFRARHEVVGAEALRRTRNRWGSVAISAWAATISSRTSAAVPTVGGRQGLRDHGGPHRAVGGSQPTRARSALDHPAAPQPSDLARAGEAREPRPGCWPGPSYRCARRPRSTGPSAALLVHPPPLPGPRRTRVARSRPTGDHAR